MSSFSGLYVDVNLESFPTVLKATETALIEARAQFQKNNPLLEQVKTVVQNSLPTLPENLVPDENTYSPKTMDRLNTKLKELLSKPPKKTGLWSLKDLTNYASNDAKRQEKPNGVITRATTAHFSVKDLSDILGRQATADELLNFYLGKPLNEKICEDDYPKITPLYLINWKKIKALDRQNRNLDCTVTLEDMKTYLNWDRLPTIQEPIQLNF